MYIYFFFLKTGLFQSCKPISVGIITENNEIFYAEFKVNTGYVSDETQDLIKDNILLSITTDKEVHSFNYKNITLAWGDQGEVGTELLSWLNVLQKKYPDVIFQFVGDCANYDIMLLENLICTWETKQLFPTPEEIKAGKTASRNIITGNSIYPANISRDFVNLNYEIAVHINKHLDTAIEVDREDFIKDYKKQNIIFDATNYESDIIKKNDFIKIVRNKTSALNYTNVIRNVHNFIHN